VKKIQDSKQIGEKVLKDGSIVPVIQPEVYERIYCKNCENEVDSKEQATGTCSSCGKPWNEQFARDIKVNVPDFSIVSSIGK
jgi:Zn finger protein HypA/HybF involved in hydrogenase expression|tara:strand:- start:460 stop:705 length:246 start_codon:yes stop_codon:yes gene_type:complete